MIYYNVIPKKFICLKKKRLVLVTCNNGTSFVQPLLLFLKIEIFVLKFLILFLKKKPCCPPHNVDPVMKHYSMINNWPLSIITVLQTGLKNLVFSKTEKFHILFILSTPPTSKTETHVYKNISSNFTSVTSTRFYDK